MSGPDLNPLVPGDQKIFVSWVNDPSVNIQNAFLFVLNKATNVMTKLNLTDDEAFSQEYVIADPSYNVVNGIQYLVQYVQQQNVMGIVTFASGTESTVPFGPPAPVVIALDDNLDEGALIGVTYGSNNGAPFTRLEFKICDVSLNIMLPDQYFDFPDASGNTPAPGSVCQYELTGLTNGNPYKVAAYVYNGDNSSSANISNTISVFPTDLPAAPTDVEAASGMNAMIQITFTNPTAQPVPVANWVVYKNTVVSPGVWDPIATPAYVDGSGVYVVNDTAVTNGVAYQYRVTGVSTTAVEGEPSSVAAAVPWIAVEAGSLTVLSEDEAAFAVWTPNPLINPTATFITALPFNGAWDLEYSPDATFDTSSVLLEDLPWNALNQEITGLTNGTEYFFRVRAKSLIPSGLRSSVQYPPSVVADLNYAAGAWIVRSTIPDVVPGAPTDLAFIVSDSAVQLTWDEPSTTGSSPVLRYTVYRYSSAVDASINNFDTSYNVFPPFETYTVTGLSNTSSYWFRVSASNTVGEGPLSATVGPATPTTTVEVPQNADVLQLDASSTFIDVQLTWQPPTSVPAGITVTGYDVFAVDSLGNLTLLDNVPVGDISGGVYTYVERIVANPTLPKFVRYALQTIAVNGVEIRSIYLFVNGQISVPPVIDSYTFDSVNNKYTFLIDTQGLNIVSAVLYAPYANSEPPIPTPVTLGESGPGTFTVGLAPYEIELDYEPVTSPFPAFFFVLSTAGGSDVLIQNV